MNQKSHAVCKQISGIEMVKWTHTNCLNWNGCLVMSVNKFFWFHFLYGKTLNCVWQTAKLHTREHNVSKLVSYWACHTRLILFSLQIPLWSAYTWLVPLMRSENHPPVFMTGITTHALCLCLTDSFLVAAHNYFSRWFQTQDDINLWSFCEVDSKDQNATSHWRPDKNACPHTCSLSLSLCVCASHLLKPR